MMDLKEIIKWFIPCFHVLEVILKVKDLRLTFICLFLLFNFRAECAPNVNNGVRIFSNNTKYVDNLGYENKSKLNQSDVWSVETRLKQLPAFTDGSVGRTFGRPFKKMMAGLLPIIFQVGAASTWAVVAALVGLKTLLVSLVILKILLIAGAAKVGALFGSKGHGHYSQGWEIPQPPQKEIHLHIHNGHPEGHDDHVPVYGPWSREDATNAVALQNNAVDPYSRVGPQTIRTPFGNYVKLESNDPLLNPSKRK